MKRPGIIIAATNSGCGKTTVTMGLLKALVIRGLKVQSYKVGPDYIDPMFHKHVTGNASRNLDSFLLEGDVVKYLYEKSNAKADISVIEGVMGLYDGLGGNSITGSTAHVSVLLDVPIILVVNAKGMSLSIAAVIKGFMDFHSDLRVEGVILNNVNSEALYLHLKKIVEEHCKIKVCGYLPQKCEYALESRHLGLVPAEELDVLDKRLELLVEQIEHSFDIPSLLDIARNSGELVYQKPELFPLVDMPLIDTNRVPQKNSTLRIAIAMDKAFNFYYQDNIDLLEEMGAEIIYFSPLKDAALPDNISGIMLGGGFPEVFAKELSENKKMLENIKSAAESDMPIYAECGGLMYLCEEIKTLDGCCYNMAGVFPGKSFMTKKLQRFGYVNVDYMEKEISLKAHEFHHSNIDMNAEIERVYQVSKAANTKKSWSCGYKYKNVLAAYAHIHFYSNIQFARHFMKKCYGYEVSF